MRGEMLFFNQEKGGGFIRTEEGERLYVDRSGFVPGEAPEGRCAGMRVDFTRGPNFGEHEYAAFGVSMVPEFVGGRARRRRQN
jgi:cold shock CspA family protein